VQDTLAVVGVPRSLIQGWSEVAELADLPLRRVDWSLTTAQRALHQLTQAQKWRLCWLVHRLWHERRSTCNCVVSGTESTLLFRVLVVTHA
jgi:hypothetical protein